ncbi:hypothetical protein F5148DRAFT_1181791 [Russula earlei]|uniref:Uncharacterized protein n=1 Tax=Russula earlei TaxID=71964 RepID=A0ACC0UGF6_9AGAM|nr:hypothetical protein F5148DRAFT_1181791 [Russula earlei]
MKRTRTAILVSYDESTDSEDEGEKGTKPPKERPSPPPPPVKRRKLPALAAHLAPAVPLDDPSKHQGRTRTTPHVEGQWAAYVYVPLALRGTLRRVVERAVEMTRREVPGVRVLGGPDPGSDSVADLRELHISLTRPFYLRAHQRDEMKRAVRDAARSQPPFAASFAAFSDLTNDEHTRTFLSMEIGAGHQELRALSAALSAALHSFRQKEYYEQPRFHASFAWVLLARPAQDLPSQSSEPLELSPSATPSEGSARADTSSFSTIAHLPENIVPALNAQLGSQLKGSAGVFDAEEVRIRIGKDVFSWTLAG